MFAFLANKLRNPGPRDRSITAADIDEGDRGKWVGVVGDDGQARRSGTIARVGQDSVDVLQHAGATVLHLAYDEDGYWRRLYAPPGSMRFKLFWI